MNKQLYILWAFAAGLLNNHVLTASSPTNPSPLAFRRGTDEFKLIHCDTAKPGWVTYEMPDGNRDTQLLADGELGQLVTNYARATGVQIELPPLMGYGDETQASAAAAGYDQSRVHP